MRLQVIQDDKGKNTGVFIPIKDWDAIKVEYPDIENTIVEIPQWEKELIDSRLKSISENPDRIKKGTFLISELKRKI